MQKIIIDTDAGDDVDDVLAIAFALLHDAVKVEAMTTVGWRSIERARLVRKLLHAAGQDNVPVAAGFALPMTPQTPEQFAGYSRPGKLSHTDVVGEDEQAAFEPVGTTAVDLLIRTIEASPGEISIVCIGQLSNVAAALCARPEIAGRIQQIAIMGGELEIVRREHNIACDAIAAELVLRAGVPVFLGTWSVTRQFVLDEADCNRIKAHGSALTDLLGRCIDRWWPTKGGKVGPVMYDLSPIIWTFDRSPFEVKPMRLRVETAGELTQGMTMPQPGASADDANALVTTGIDAERVREMYLSTLLA